MLALTQVELEDMKLLRDSAPTAGGTTPGDTTDYDEDLAEELPDIERTAHKLQDLLPSISCRLSTSPGASPDPPKGQFVLHHHDLSFSNVIVDPVTYKVTGIVDWERVAIIPTWEDTYLQFLEGPEVHEKPEPLAGGETDKYA